jgi:uncharacterized protein (DUF433 family)
MHGYVEQRDGGYYLVGSRIGLDAIVYPFKQGASPESLLQSFPTVGSLEKVYGAITFYLANKELVEAYLADQERLWDDVRRSQPPRPGSLAERLEKARRELVSR